ncbi:MAG TPA: serine hydroxymethyltransferase [Herpetosiphonaceae bacterium]
MLAAFAQTGIDLLFHEDRALYDLLDQEYQRQQESLVMVASSSIADPSVLVCEGMVTGNTTTEGYPGARFHAGCAWVDAIERLAIERAQAAFGARYANVQPHSGSSANQILLFALLKSGDTILGLDLSAGGHLTHGARASVSGQHFHAVGYGLDRDGLIDYDQVRQLALRHRPRLIICGASAYPRAIDFARFRAIADEVGAFLLADISHIAGLVAAGVHPSPIDHAHFTTTSTYKQLYGPRGGLILMGRDADTPAPGGRGTLADLIQRAVFPFFQGTPNLSAIAAKARALALVNTPEFRALARQIVANAQALARHLAQRDYHVLTGGSDNHIVLIDTLARGTTGLIAERALESCQIIVNRNKIPGDTKPALVTSGMRLGTNSLARRGMEPADMALCAELIDRVLSTAVPLGDSEYELSPDVRRSTLDQVRQLCHRFPIPRYPPTHRADETRNQHE